MSATYNLVVVYQLTNKNQKYTLTFDQSKNDLKYISIYFSLRLKERVSDFIYSLFHDVGCLRIYFYPFNCIKFYIEMVIR